ncbi:hypothetical protein [Leuconostoc miyukkimchii]|uniref:hypothetical protein n=1 Tax=Leuconostoc miyukkimchii TaxID=910540 RepID=UPI001C7DC2FD|nr:hypothetical protein [Leuconostoc miyukkimchii]
MYTGDESFEEADASYTINLINGVTRDYWTGSQTAEMTVKKILEKINMHKDRVRMEG